MAEGGRIQPFLPDCLSRDLDLLLPLDSWFSGLQTRADLHYWLSWVSSWQIAFVGLLSLHNYISQFLLINLFIYILFLSVIQRHLSY